MVEFFSIFIDLVPDINKHDYFQYIQVTQVNNVSSFITKILRISELVLSSYYY